MVNQELAALNGLEHKKKIVFAYLACLRVVGNCFRFSDKYNFGNKKNWQEAIDRLAMYIYENKTSTPSDIENLCKKIKHDVPIPGNFPNYDASIALDSASLIIHALHCLSSNEIAESLKLISSRMTTIIDCYLLSSDEFDIINDPDFENVVLHHPLMLTEINIQKGIILYLKKISALHAADIELLEQLQKNSIQSYII